MKEVTITLPLGFRFVVKNAIVEVREGHSCNRCDCFTQKGCLLASSPVTCSASLRSDRVEVVFVKVGEARL